MPQISIIVPVYKAEAYLHRCINSLLSQTFEDFEILLIDDGSPDNSGKLCDEYAKKDCRIKVFHKENGGVSSARQCGIDNALGEYTIHVDPDDWVEPNMLEELYGKAVETDADIIICDYFEYKNRKVVLHHLNLETLEPQILLKKFLQQELHAAMWNKLIKTLCYKKYNLKFPENIIRWEDLYVVCSLLTNPIKISYLSKALYYYDQSINGDSIIRKPTMKGLMSQLYFIEHFSQKLDSKIYEKELYIIKAVTKELAFTSNLMPVNELIKLYSEINKIYLSEQKFNSVHICLSLMLRGYPNVGKFLYRIYNRLISK